MYRITSKVFGSIRIENKDLGFNSSILVDALNNNIIELQQSGLVKVEKITSTKEKKQSELFDNVKENKKKDKKDKN